MHSIKFHHTNDRMRISSQSLRPTTTRVIKDDKIQIIFQINIFRDK